MLNDYKIWRQRWDGNELLLEQLMANFEFKTQVTAPDEKFWRGPHSDAVEIAARYPKDLAKGLYAAHASLVHDDFPSREIKPPSMAARRDPARPAPLPRSRHVDPAEVAEREERRHLW